DRYTHAPDARLSAHNSGVTGDARPLCHVRRLLLDGQHYSRRTRAFDQTVARHILAAASRDANRPADTPAASIFPCGAHVPRDHHRRVWAVDQRTAGRITRPELEAVRRQADLLEWRPSIPEQYYRPETLASARAHGACSSCLIGSVHGGLSRQMGASPTLESP